MRRVRIAAFTFAASLICLLVARVLSVDPAPAAKDDAAKTDASKNDAILQADPDGPENVPPPPALPGKNAAQPVKRPVPQDRIAMAPSGPVQDVPASEVKATIWRGNDPADSDQPKAVAVSQIATTEEPKGPVIVVPRERQKEESRGSRVLKAVGHALGIGNKPSPAEEAFR